MANLTLRRSNESNLPAQNRPALRGIAGWDPFRLMDSLLNWDPFQEMVPALPQGATGPVFMPNFEVKETKDAYVFKADMPGIKESDLDISLTGNHLTISGKREAESHEDVQNYFTYERTYGSFSRSFTLPQSADANNVKAELKDGVLTLALPKKPEMQPRKIALGEGSQNQGNQGTKAKA
jgi:HSP20 family protein